MTTTNTTIFFSTHQLKSALYTKASILDSSTSTSYKYVVRANVQNVQKEHRKLSKKYEREELSGLMLSLSDVYGSITEATWVNVNKSLPEIIRLSRIDDFPYAGSHHCVCLCVR